MRQIQGKVVLLQVNGELELHVPRVRVIGEYVTPIHIQAL